MTVEAQLQSQKDYRETPYADASWEIVGEAKFGQDFEPLRFDVQPTSARMVDPMFEDLGGTTDAQVTRRWHLPESEGYAPELLKERQRQEAERREQERLAELERIRTEAYEQGRQAAYVEAVEENSVKMAELEKRCATLFQDLVAQSQESRGVLERKAIELAVQISEKIMGTAVEINPEYLVPVFNEAIALAGSAVVRRIRVSPQDLEFVNVVGIARQVKEFDPSWEFVADESIKAGCVLETSAGEVDYQLDKAWERVRDNVLKVAR